MSNSISSPAHSPRIQSDYLKKMFDKQRTKEFLKLAKPLLKKYDFQAIAFCGVSGALVAPLLAYKINKTLIVVRKIARESSHSMFAVEGDLNAKRYLIVDDFISTGYTVRDIVEKVSIVAPSAKCIGCIQYNQFFSQGDDVPKKEITNLKEKLGLRWREVLPFIEKPEDCLIKSDG